MARFTEKKIVITGGSSGIGLAAARRIVDEGGAVLVTGTNPERLAKAKLVCPALHTLVNDAADVSAAPALAAEAEVVLGSVDGVFLNAGAGAGAPLGGITLDLYRNQIDLNLGGPLFALQALLPLLNGGASVVITSSAAKDHGVVGASLYAAAKGAVRAMVRSIALELAPRAIRANTVSPGPISTEFFNRLPMPQHLIEKIVCDLPASNPLRRMGSSDEAAAVALFLLSDDASFVTGSDYPVDGGEVQV